MNVKNIINKELDEQMTGETSKLEFNIDVWGSIKDLFRTLRGKFSSNKDVKGKNGKKRK